tara:strand:+ start:233 stop:463 length:231 start_codon:yes stop_codon:yes gene_type:complete
MAGRLSLDTTRRQNPFVSYIVARKEYQNKLGYQLIVSIGNLLYYLNFDSWYFMWEKFNEKICVVFILNYLSNYSKF